MFNGSSFAVEHWTGTNAYWKLFCCGWLDKYQCLLEALLLWMTGKTPMLLGNTLDLLSLVKGVVILGRIYLL